MKIAVLIPCYNEALTIAKVVADYRAALPEAELYVYDNNSRDGTDRIAREAGATVRYERRQGKGNVIRTMFRDIDADVYLMIDGDDTYPAENAREMVDLVRNNRVDMVVGDRLGSTYFTVNRRPFHNTGNRLVRALVNRMNEDVMAHPLNGAQPRHTNDETLWAQVPQFQAPQPPLAANWRGAAPALSGLLALAARRLRP